MKVSIISPNLSGCVSILDCGVTYLATYLNERTTHKATIWDYTFKRKHWRNYLKEKYQAEKPDVIGITYTTLYKSYVLETIREIRKNLSKDIPIILGGYHPTLRPRESLSVEGVTGVVIGEGEYIFEKYLDRLENRGDLTNISGFCFKTEDGRMYENPRDTWIPNINDLPFPDYELWDEIDTYLYFLGQLWLIGSRGCPYDCTNCEELYIRNAVPGRRYRVRDPKNYVDEIKFHYEKFKDRGFRMAHPFDPVFPINNKWTKQFCEEYIKQGLSKILPLSIFSRGDTFFIRQEGEKSRDTFDEERLKLLADAGCKEIRIGIEAGSERVRNGIHEKGVTNKQLETTFAMCKKYDIVTIAYNMLGGPTETKKEMLETFKFNIKVGANKPIFFIYQQLAHDVEMSMIGEFTASITNEMPKYLESNKSRNEEDSATIQFGEPMESEHFSKKWLVYFQLLCYAYFVGLRVIRLFIHQPISFFPNFFTYMYRGYKTGANMKIVFAYFLGSCGKNLYL